MRSTQNSGKYPPISERIGRLRDRPEIRGSSDPRGSKEGRSEGREGRSVGFAWEIGTGEKEEADRGYGQCGDARTMTAGTARATRGRGATGSLALDMRLLGLKSVLCKLSAMLHACRHRDRYPVARQEEAKQPQQPADPQRTARSAPDSSEIETENTDLHVFL